MNHAQPTAYSNLPVKITVLVFWGLALFGSAIAIWLAHDLENKLIESYQADADRVTYRLEKFFQSHSAISTASLQAEMEQVRALLGVPGVAIRVDGQMLAAGHTGKELASNVREIYVHDLVDPALSRNLLVSIFHARIEDAINDQRSRLLMSMGVVLLLFGLGLVWALQHLLTGPFTAMVNTAQAFSRGDVSQRFNDERKDEFGFLATFINKALDQLLAQKEALFREKERAEVTLHSIGEGVITTDSHGNVEYLNPVAEKLTGWDLQEARGLAQAQIMRLIDETSREPVENPVDQCLREGGIVAVSAHTVLVRRDGQELAIAHSAAPIRGHSGQVMGVVTVFQDVAEARKLEQQLSYQASHDALTGLFNRVEFERQLRDAQTGGQQNILCYLDLDQFKIVNDTCGHVAGDELLRQIAGVLRSRLRGSDVLARLGGDEFGVLLKHCDPQQAPIIAESLCHAVKDLKFVWGEHSFETGVSIGLVNIDENMPSVSEALSTADVACYAAKDKGRNQVHVYEPDDKELKERRGEMQWVPRIRRAVEENRFRLYYQPIVPINQGPDAELHRELLIRLLDEAGELVPPMAFIPAAERYGLMPEIDRWVIRTALRALGGQCSGDCDWVCTINLSGQSLCDNTFLDYAVEQLRVSGVSPDRICFEITETAAIANLVRASHFISVLKSMGCRFALDDFGSGLSSFAYLKNLRVDYLKIDGSFVRDMLADPIDHALVEAINQIGHVMGIRTMAEFVENDEILAALRELGVDYAQGYGIAKPAPLEEITTGAVRACANRRS